MKIDMKELYASEEVIDKYITLKEELLTLYTLDNYIERKRTELGKPLQDHISLAEFGGKEEEAEKVEMVEAVESEEKEEEKKSKEKKEKVKKGKGSSKVTPEQKESKGSP